MRTQKPKQWRVVLFCGVSLWVLTSAALAQDASETPLGDVARSFRKKVAASEAIIDNDNLSKVVDDAEGKRAAGVKPVFSLDPGTNALRVSSPDVTCSLSFTAKNSSASESLLLEDLPRSELVKLDGPATIDGDSLQVSVHNGTAWELHEIVIGLTIVKRPDLMETGFGQPQFISALAAEPSTAQDPSRKQPDVTLLLHVKGSAAPSVTAVFRTALNFALFPDQDWHWAIVRAKGIPPQTSPVEISTAQPEAGNLPLPGLRQAALQGVPPVPAASSPSSSPPPALPYAPSH